ncbi:hypothetical protein Tco_0293881 [Tanacetum coccineum]
MADLIFADSHNMVAYLEKLEDNADFAEIVNFLNASPISSKSTAWNEFGTNIASTIICLAKKQKFNFSKLIFDAVFNDEYDTPSHTKKVFANMRMQGKDFSGTVTPLFATMLIQSQAVEGEEPIPIVASSSQPKKTKKHRKSKRMATEISQSSRPTNLVADETIHEERGDNVERAVIIATSLDAEQGSCGSPRRQDTMGDRPTQTRFERLSKQSNEPPLSRVNTLGSGEDSMKLQELMDLCTKLSDRVLDLENVKDAQALEIKKLKKRVKKLESKKKSRTPQLKRILFKVRIESSAEKSLGDQEDSSKQGRNEIDQDEGISYTPITTAGVSISTAKPSHPPPTTTTTLIEDEDRTIAQTLMMMKSKKLKIRERQRWLNLTNQRRRNIKIEYDADVAQRLQAELDEEAMLEREREEEASKAANIAEWDDLMDKRKKHFAKLRAEEQRRKPSTKTQKRNIMSTYLKNMAGYKQTQLKNKSFEEIQMLFEKEIKRVNLFVDMDAELVKGRETREESGSKRA